MYPFCFDFLEAYREPRKKSKGQGRQDRPQPSHDNFMDFELFVGTSVVSLESFTTWFFWPPFFFWCKTKIVEAKGRYLSNKSLRHKRDPTKTTSFWGSRLGRKGLFWIDLQIDLRSMMIINSNDTLSKRLSPWGTSKRNMVLLTTEFFPMSLSCSYVNWLLIFDCSMATRRTWHVCLQKKGSLKRKFSWYGSNFESVYHELWYISTWMSEGI